MTVSGAAGKIGAPDGDVVDAQRSTGGREHLYDGPPASGVTLVDTSKAMLDGAVQIGVSRVGRHPEVKTRRSRTGSETRSRFGALVSRG